MVNNVILQGDFMRLHNIYFICTKYIDTIKHINFASASTSTYKIINWTDVKQALNELYLIDSIKDSVKKLYNCIDPISRDADIPIVSPNTKTDITSNQKILISKMQAIIDLYESLGNDIQESGIDIKIPKCSNLKEYINYLKEIDFILTQCPFLLSKDENIVFKTVDVGSIWVTFAVVGGTCYILKNLAKLINEAVAIKSNMLVYKQQEEQLHTMRNKNEISEEVIKAFKTLKDNLIKESVISLENEIAPLSNGEERDKAGKSLEKLVFLMDKGLEIYSSIETPKEVKVLFPMQETQTSLTDDVLKFLEAKSK